MSNPVPALPWLATVVLATVWTYLWLFRDKRLQFTTAFAAAFWLLSAYLLEDLVVLSGGEVTHVPLPSLQWMFTGLALVSLVTFVFTILGIYPPEESPEADEDHVFAAEDGSPGRGDYS